MKMRTLLIAFLLFPLLMSAQSMDPVSWEFDMIETPDGDYQLILEAMIDPGWNIYSQYLESDEGPVATDIQFEEMAGFELLGKVEEVGKKKEGFDQMFEMNIVKYADRVQFVQNLKKTGEGHSVSGSVLFMTCDDEKCLPPKNVPFTIDIQ